MSLQSTEDRAESTRERRTCTVDEAAELIGIARHTAYEAVRRGDLPAIRVGRRWLVLRAALERMLDGSP